MQILPMLPVAHIFALGFYRRLTEYKARNTEDTTVVNYFDVLEIHPAEIINEVFIVV